MSGQDSTAGAYARLSAPAERSPMSLSRRRFLQVLGATGAAAGVDALVPGWAAEAFGLTPLGPSDGVLVVILMGGGNDALNTLAPVADGRYRDLRGGAALDESEVLPLAGGCGLHPALGYLKRRYDAGDVAIVQGVGYDSPDLSHFVSMATWMRGWGGPGRPMTGWLGRYLDALGSAAGADPLHAVQLGASVPLHLVGATRRATALGTSAPFGSSTEPNYARLASSVAGFADGPTGLGRLGDLIAATQRDLVEVARAVAPVYDGPELGSGLADRLRLAARLVNADLGIRVLSVGFGDFDAHNGLRAMHDARMAELDDALAAFDAALDGRFAQRVGILTFSEFGRRPALNGNGGTDHGTAGLQLLIGAQVRGGLVGEAPSLADLDRGNLRHGIHFGSVYATVLDRWLGADSGEILGHAYEPLDLFVAGPTSTRGGDPPAPDPARPAGLVALTPQRTLDTRRGVGATARPIGPGETLELVVVGVGDVPASGATGVVLNVTALSRRDGGYLTVWPTGEARPLASNLNFVAGQVVPNLVTAKLGSKGRVSIYNHAGSTDVIADVVGYLHDGDGLALAPIRPVRLLDTRDEAAPFGPGEERDLVVTGAGPAGAAVPVDGVASVVLNVTVTEPTEAGYLSVSPSGQPRPDASNLNFVAGQTVPNLVVAKVGTGGRVRLFNSAGWSHVLVDLAGFVQPAVGAAGRFVALAPARVLDTRELAGGRLSAGEERLVGLAGRGGLPGSGVAGVVANVTVTEPAEAGFLTAWPAGTARPNASNLNFVAGQTVPNLVVVGVDAAGAACLFANVATHVVVDVVGYVTAA
ncbi:MAG: DUF1501 domain-containing protein [Acidimicrobiia bacterium]|nr:DUF1501 domain-containing protein [Acidimicrobiia bacterium]